VLPNQNVEWLALAERFLLKNRSRATALNKLSPTLSKPSAAMLLSAFEEDNANFGALQTRIKRFLELTEPGDDVRDKLSFMAILPVDGQARAPRELALKGSKGDYWGAWKTPLPATGLSQEVQTRYRKIGVTPSGPTTEASRAFFEWLSDQDEEVLGRHIGRVLRHILHPNGPVAWAETYTDTPFIPARSQLGLQLVSLRSVRRPLYLPDLEYVADLVLERDPRVLLAIESVREVAEPITEALRSMRVRSLREAIGEPERVEGSGYTQAAPEAFLKTLIRLRSPRFQGTIRKRLYRLGIESVLIRRDWHDRISRIDAIRFAQDVQARYAFRRKHYRAPVDAGFDPVSGTFWIKEGQQDGVGGFYEAIAAQLVFKPTARPVHWLALERALRLEISDPSFGRPESWEAIESEVEESGNDEEDEGEDETTEAVYGHAPFEPDPSRNIPQPRPIPSSPRAGIEHRGGNRGRRTDASAGGDVSPAPALEKEHREQLKSEHYASHCQMCLCERSPLDLAPAGSYVEWEEVRRHIVQAHHVDPKSGRGARHAGNLILLCKRHHDNYGRRLTREAVTTALRASKTEKIVHFGRDDNPSSEVVGCVTKVVIPDNGDVVSIFFTNEHVGYWLSQAHRLRMA